MIGPVGRVLGVSPTKSFVYLALLEDGVVLAQAPLRMPAPDPAAGQSAIVGFVGQFANALANLRPEMIGLLLPQAIYKATYDTLAPRAAAEALIAVAAEQAHIPLQRFRPQSLRPRLRLGKGPLNELLANVEVGPPGKYWNEGRRDAALVGLALT